MRWAWDPCGPEACTVRARPNAKTVGAWVPQRPRTTQTGPSGLCKLGLLECWKGYAARPTLSPATPLSRKDHEAEMSQVLSCDFGGDGSPARQGRRTFRR